MDPEIKDLITTLIPAQSHTDQSLRDLTAAVSHYVDASDSRMSRSDSRMSRMEQGLEGLHHLAAEADVRLRRTEENLDILVRAITQEHSNGHSKQK